MTPQLRFSTPMAPANPQTLRMASASTDPTHPDRVLAFTNPRPTKGMLAPPPGFQRPEARIKPVEIPQKRVDLPRFEGSNPDEWIFCLEQSFVVNKTPESEKLGEALSCLTGAAVAWWNVYKAREKITTSDVFRDRFKERFKPSRGCSTLDMLLGITQKGTVDEYMEQFEELCVGLPRVADEVLFSTFIRGLKKNLRDQVLRCRPRDLNDNDIESQENDTGFQPRVFSKPHYTAGTSNNRVIQHSPGKTSEYVPPRKPFGNQTSRSNPCRYFGEQWAPGHDVRRISL